MNFPIHKERKAWQFKCKCKCKSCLPEAHDKVLDNSPDRIGIWKCWFLRRGENRSTRRKTSRSKEENNNKLNPQMTSGPEIEPGTHLWEASALTTAALRHPCSHPLFGKIIINNLRLMVFFILSPAIAL